MDEHGEDLGPDGQRALAVGAVLGAAVDAVLGGVEVAVGELGHVVVEVAVDHVESVALVGLGHRLVDLAHAGERELVVGGELVERDGVGRRVELALDLAEQEAQGVANLAVGLADVREDRVVAGHVVGGVDGGDPQAHDVGAAGVALGVRVDDVAEATGSTQSAVSHQLRTLKQAHLVKFERDGRNIVYSLADNHVYTMLNQGMSHICE